MANKINFITGETYTLAELFSEERQVIIPDLQRDYCWGNDNNNKTSGQGDLVSDFVKSLLEQFAANDKESLNLGLLYGYEIPANHIQLCDGQQRITTLFLLLGMINKRTGALRQHLISDFEYKHDDKEPYLKYAIRESSLYFLSDLVCNFFISNTDTVDKIKTADWYFRDYDLDPSIQSMIKALGIIEKLLSETRDLNVQDFSEWLLHKLTFMYVDMENRKNGEETFVVINTTGEPLSATENLKPLVINSIINKDICDVDSKWEEIETWFWQHRAGNNDTADAGFNEFLKWVTMLHSGEKDLQTILKDGNYAFPIDNLSFEEIYSYWHAVVFLFEKWEHRDYLKLEFLSPSTNKGITQIECFKLLPIIEFCKKYAVNDINDRNLYRLYMFLHNLCKIENVTKNVNDIVWDAINIARNCMDILELADNDFGISTILLSKEERLKLNILKSNIENRNNIEELFWNAQNYNIECHKIWSGEILPLIEWASDNDKFDIHIFKEYLAIFDETFKGQCDANIDDVRRALLTRNLKQYPRIFSGYTVYSFGWEWRDWKILINDNKPEFKLFFNDLKKGVTCEQMIHNYPQENDWAEFVHDKRLMAYCTKKNLQWHNKSWYLMEREKWSAAHANVNAYKYYLYLKCRGNVNEGWETKFWASDDTCVYYDQIHCENRPYMSIDIIWNVGKDNLQIEIDLFMKPTYEIEVVELTKQNLQSLADNFGYRWNDTSKRYVKYLDIIKNEKELYTIIDNECEQILKRNVLYDD